MSSPDWSPRMIDENLVSTYENSDTPNIIYINAPAICGEETVREELRETLENNFPSIHHVEDDDDQVNVIKVYYYGDEADIDEDKVLDVVRVFDGSASITSY